MSRPAGPYHGPVDPRAPLAAVVGALLLTGCTDQPRGRPGLALPPGGDADAGADAALDATPPQDTGGGPDVTPDAAPADDAGGGPGPGRVCVPGQTRCMDDRLSICLPSGLGWSVEACPDGELCVEGRCEERECSPGTTRCEGDAVATCHTDTLTWSEPRPCDTGETCTRGVCIPQACEPGAQLCGRSRVLTCADDGLTWIEEVCPEGWVCFDARCLACLRDADCGPDRVCVEDACVPRPLTVTTAELPDGMVGQAYEAALEAAGGTAPYAWTPAGQAPLPAGLALDPSGRLAGTPEAEGDHALVLRVEDAEGQAADAAVSLRIHGAGLVIVTDALPQAEDGLEYRAELEALGGTSPYAWMIVAGVLPDGLMLSADGVIEGVPGGIGDFPLTVRVFDAATPPGWADRELLLSVRIAPLEIVGDQEFDLFLFKVVTLPLITVVEGLPLPYSTPLRARGGLRPYHWEELEVPQELRWLLPRAGIPDGLELAADGTLEGAVDSTEQVISLTIPFTQITLHGFFFTARVTDSQEPAESRTAIFLLPTLPVGGGN